MPKYFSLLALFFCFHFSTGQNNQISGIVRETFTQTPLPFVHIIMNGGENELFTDLDGNFQTPPGIPIRTLSFRHHLHRNAEYIWFPSDSMPLSVNMNKYLPFFYESETDSVTSGLIEKVMQNRGLNRMENLKPFTYNTYNKYTFGAEKNEHAIKHLRKRSGKLRFGLHDLKDKQHFFIVESVTERKYYNAVKQKEKVIGAKASGVNLPSIFIQTSQLEAFSIYDNYTIIAGSTYISPLADNTLDRYEFLIIDTAMVDQDTIYIVKFNPKAKKYFQAMRGTLYINSRNYGVQYALVSPAERSSIEINFAQSYRLYDNIFFPDQSKTTVVINKGSQSAPKLKAYGRTFIYNVKTRTSVHKQNFDEVILEYKRYANDRNEDFWKEERKEVFSEADSNTYLYFDSLDRNKKLDKILRATERIYYGEVPVGKVNIEINRSIDYNLLERLRLGFGAHTNESFSEKYSVGAHLGYGTADQKLKYGTHFLLNIENRFRSTYNFSYSYDVKEAGATSLPFETRQYSSESLRKYRLRIMDYVREWSNALNFRPVTYMQVRLRLSHSHNTPSYDYVYKSQYSGSFNFTDLSLGMRYAYGEKVVQIINQNLLQFSKYPIVYFQFTRGLNNFFNGDYSYSKFDFRIDQNFKKFKFGTTGVQLAGGITKGNAPYFKLYNGKGSLRQPSIVIHNSFETMRYNEFLSDKYIALFFSHDFGKLYLLRNPNIAPSLMFLHNIGFGTLKNPEDHQGLAFKTMQKGYFESGLFLDNIIVIPTGGLKTGIGTGVFVRYGPNALPGLKNNVVFKLSTNFFI
ncbi:MAG TPA: DUF5686 family protein [Cytophagaceae bacterium]|jgi:hypothetical protein|nr:DUF5686 family protein [Cytophagaceae bacterium]